MNKREIVGDALRLYRLARKMTQEEQAKEWGKGALTVYNYEKGFRTPTIDFIWELADKERCSIDDLIGRTQWLKEQGERYV